MKIKGEKIYLKKGLSDENYQTMLDWFTDLKVMRYVSWARKASKFKTKEEVKKFCAGLESGIFFEIYTNDDKFIGYTSLSHFQRKEWCEFGIFILDKNYWGKGLGFDITKMIVDYAFSKLGMKKVMLSTSEFHKNAIRLYEKAGFKKTEIIPSARKIYQNNKWVLSGTVLMEIKKC